MGELQKLYVTLALDAADFAKGMQGAEQQARGFGGRIGGALSGIGTVARTAFLGVGAAAVGGFALAMNSAIGMNASLETSTLQFTTLMGSAEQAQVHVQNLFDFAAATPFDSQQIIDASLKLQTFGGEALNTMENLTLVGDAAAAVNAPIDEVAFWVGRLYSNLQAGQPFGEAAMRLQELGIMAPQARTELENMQAAGLSGTEIFGAFQGQLGAFTGAMEAQSGTWQGLMSTIKDNLQMAMADGLRPFFDLAKQGLEGLAKWLSSPEVQNGIKQFAARLSEVIQRVAEFVTERVIPFVQSHGPQLKAIVIALAVAFGALLVIGAVATAIGLLTNPITWIVVAIGALAAAWTADWGGIRTKTEEVVAFLRGLVEVFLANLRAWWEEHGEAILAAARQAWELIQGLIDGVVRHIELIVEGFRAAFEGDWERFGEIIFELWENAWDTVVNFLGGLWDMVLPWLTNIWNSLVTWFTTTDWKQLGLDVINGIVNGLQSAGEAIISTIMGFVTAAWDRVKAFFGISSPSKLMFYAGEMIVQGLIDGLESMTDGLGGKIDDIMDLLGELSNVGGGFGGIFKTQTLDPLEKALGDIGAGISNTIDLLGAALPENFAEWEEGRQRLLLRQLAGTGFLAANDEEARARVLLSLLDERGRVTKEYIEQQERLVRLQEKQAQLDFLEKQFDLIKLVRDNGLDTGLLAGFEFGLNADAGALMDAMTGAMQAMIQAAEDQLGIHSPSRWAIDTMRNVFGTMARTAQDEVAGLRRALEPSLMPALAGLDGRTDNSRRATNYGGYHVTVQGNEKSPLEQLWGMAQ